MKTTRTNTTKGTVTMPLDEYNELFEDAMLIKRLLKITSYSNQVEVEFDFDKIRPLIISLIEERFELDKLDIKTEFYSRSTYVAEIKEGEE